MSAQNLLELEAFYGAEPMSCTSLASPRPESFPRRARPSRRAPGSSLTSSRCIQSHPRPRLATVLLFYLVMSSDSAARSRQVAESPHMLDILINQATVLQPDAWWPGSPSMSCYVLFTIINHLGDSALERLPGNCASRAVAAFVAWPPPLLEPASGMLEVQMPIDISITYMRLLDAGLACTPPAGVRAAALSTPGLAQQLTIHLQSPRREICRDMARVGESMAGYLHGRG
jgi:hypothetical protein